jgi:hypothetical protein
MSLDARHWWLRRAVTYFGRLDDSKGLEMILEAYLRLGDDDLPPLWIVGGVPAEIDRVRASFGAKIRALESRARIEWWGFQRDDGLSTILTRSLVLVTHSQYEPGGRVVLEAMAAGVPVIATPHGFARDVVRNWSTGFLVPYADVELLRLRIEHFVRQPLLRQSLGANARSTALAALNAWRFLDTHCDVYSAAASNITPRRNEPPVSFDGNVLASRDFHDTYPFTRGMPSMDDVRAAIESCDGTRPATIGVPEHAGSSLFWRAGRWLVKHPRPRLALRPMWDRRMRRIATPAEERFAAELCSGLLPGFAPWCGVDMERLLLVRPYATASTGENGIRGLASAIALLAATPIASHDRFEAIINTRSWSEAAIADLRRIHDEMIPPLGEPPHFGLKLAWSQLLSGIGSGDVARPSDWSAADENILNLARTASEIEERAVLCHGSAHIDHVLDFDGDLRLIDGEHLHVGAEGEDLGAALLDLLRRNADANAIRILQLFGSRVPRRTIVAWTAFLTFEGLCRHAILRHGTTFSDFRRVWKAMPALLRDVM